MTAPATVRFRAASGARAALAMVTSRARQLAAGLVVVGLLLVAGPARGEELRFAGAHVAYGVGPGFANGVELRHNLDLAVEMSWMNVHHSSIGLWDTAEGLLFGVSGAIGFGAYPTLVQAEVGYGADGTLLGVGVLGGLVVQVDPEAAVGLGVRVAADFYLCQAGLRVLFVRGSSGLEGQISLTLGVGRY